MREVAATDAKAHLAELLRAVEYGGDGGHYAPRQDRRG